MASTPRLPLPRLFHRNNNSSRKVPSTSNNNSKSKDNNNNNKEPSIPAWRRLPKKNKLLFLPRQRRQHKRKQSVDTEDSMSECPETVDMIRILPEDTRSLISDLSSAPSSRGNIINNHHHHHHHHGDHSHNGWIRRHYYNRNNNNNNKNKPQYQVHQQRHPSVTTTAAATTSKEWILPHGGAHEEEVFTTTWDIDFVDDHHYYGRIRYGCSRRLLYQGTNVVSTVQDLIEFDGRAVFSVRHCHKSDPAARRIIVPASEIVSTLQDLTA